MGERPTIATLQLGAAQDLAADEVHVWRMDLRTWGDEMGLLKEFLSHEEQERADRFRIDQHRCRYIAGRAFLRFVVSGYLRCDPEHVDFVNGSAGKPSLGRRWKGRLEFNLSHSEDHALLAVSGSAQVGVDIECVRAIEDAEELVRRFFSKREARVFAQIQEEQRPQAFFNLWTRKEAMLKATGEGIGHSLRLVEVTFVPEQGAEILAVPATFSRKEDWVLKALKVAPGFAAALAVHAQGRPFRILNANGFGAEANASMEGTTA